MDRLSTEYQELLISLKQRILTSQIRAALAVNRELILLYWQIGREILLRQSQQGWGAKVIEFASRTLRDRLSQDLQAEFPELKGLSGRNLKYMRAFAEAYPEDEFVQQLVAQIPWGHNVVLLDRVKDSEARLWYAQQVTTNGWSRNILAMQIESQLYQRQGQAVINFEATLPPDRTDLVYLSAVDDLLRHPDDEPTIGMLLCRSKNGVVAEYALRDINQPMGVAQWTQALTKSLPDPLVSKLPSIAELEAELGAIELGAGGDG
ncbi:PDDEXK nuclease domain-containing protein [Chamaesiphon minutus]|uniref:YhcG N-terminal domain-containing protein n=1 Tax=Chamaesiphon minutus (strain ATCC 27169 / PCC 6605) TaxID=1173020 RepID=K9UCR2_CHAP6|nr:PDDEXK nuclease domain-containing protein [Chamaesiphon minutus]AFY92428.1 hypothetical protein Cha6605_1213 [Chamaesiphon minutus PCC 6605]